MANNQTQSWLQKLNPFTGSQADPKKNMGNYISRVQLQRYKQDAQTWREGVTEAENAFYPHRVKMQRLFIDTALNGYVAACMERRKDLTLLRKFEFINTKGEIDKKTTEYFLDAVKGQEQNKEWFSKFIEYNLDAIFFGYSLISLGDVVNDSFPNIDIVKRWNVSPDRLCVNSLVYSLSGIKWDDDEYKDWHIYTPTINEIGTSRCGYGLFYKIGIYEILLRNIQAFNSDWVELFAAPMRVGRTTKTDDERSSYFKDLVGMGSSGVLVLDPQDEIEFVESKNSGTAYKGYEDFEKRLQSKIAMMALGHADALESIPGKLGNDSAKSPAQIALQDKQTKDGQMISAIVNNELLPRMRKLGFSIPDDVKAVLKNDSEIEEIHNNVIAQAVEIKKAGLQMDSDYFTEKTGIKVSQEVTPLKPTIPLTDSVKNKLDKLYGKTEKCNCGNVH